ncbi:MAG: hypothetical protein HY319_23680 [Armatimonadetes bacterium]|nr:hypothetical protein [Armatimonadota bacterium]
MKVPPATWKVSQLRQGDDVRITSVKPVDRELETDKVVLRSIPAQLGCEVVEGVPIRSPELYEEVLYSDRALPRQALKEVRGVAPDLGSVWPGSEVRTLVSQGPTGNRINLTIVGDGYTAEQKGRFFEDAERITRDLFGEKTFAAYLPLFNVHAVFVPSRESGLSDLQSKDTALGLYRSPQGSKRGIMPGNYQNIERALDLAPATDFPILMANDDFYGGLGGRYAITSRSENSGSMVLRHELGHNFGNVGEEYDGGGVYDGANHSHSAEVPWRHWVDGELKVNEAESLVADYPWQNLQGRPYRLEFDVPQLQPGQPTRVDVDFSSVGWETPNDVAILLDGQPVEFRGVYSDDRSFFRLPGVTALPAGHHALEIREQVHDGDNVMASIKVNALAPDYDETPGKIGAYATFNAWEQHAGYRPTNRDCLMRDMRSLDFCPVDKENMWQRFLRSVQLIDAIELGEGPPGKRDVHVRTPRLPGLSIRWFEIGPEGQKRELEFLRGARRWHAPADQKGSFEVQVEFRTPEVRQVTDEFTSRKSFALG